MTSSLMTPAAKEALSKTIRGLREGLLVQLGEEAKGEYRLGIALDKAKLPEAKARRRERLEAWLEEQIRTKGVSQVGDRGSGHGGPKKHKVASPTHPEALRAQFLEQAVKEAAHTLVNRLVIVRILEAAGLSQPAVLAGGWKSQGYGELQEFAPALCADTKDDTRGYATLLGLVFDELAVELPGVFGNVGLTSLFPVPAATLREVVEALNREELDSAWRDDTTLGWVYQFWNDPEREKLDEKLNGGGKIEPHEIAPKTQMFTERYMVEWLLQNSLGQTWLAMCQRQGWTPEFESVRSGLEARRAEWRQQREAGEVAPDALMPLHSALEEQWKYWVEQPMPEGAPAAAPKSLRELKLLDPACGSGHFLVIAFDLLAALYREEARHRGEAWSESQIAGWIVEENLHGVDIDPRAIQIAAAAVWLKAKLFAPAVRLGRMNLVAPSFKLGALPEDDAALERLEAELLREVGLPRELTKTLVSALTGVDHLGTLLRVDQSIFQALAAYDKKTRGAPVQGDLFRGMPPQPLKVSLEEAQASVLGKLGHFLDAHEGKSDLGLRLEGQQLAAGLRFLEIAQDCKYHVVLANPPYLGTQKTTGLASLDREFSEGKEDLYAMFIQRSTELLAPGGIAALVTMRSWMYVSHFASFRQWVFGHAPPTALGDLGAKAFDASTNVEAVMTAFRVGGGGGSGELRVVDVSSSATIDQKRSGLATQERIHSVLVHELAMIPGAPIVYRWSREFLQAYSSAPRLGDVAPVRVGMKTSNNARYVRAPWEIPLCRVPRVRTHEEYQRLAHGWVPYIKGAAGKKWIEPLSHVVFWNHAGLSVRISLDEAYGQSPQCESLYFQAGVAYSTIGKGFLARKHRFRSIFDVAGSSVFPSCPNDVVCLLNSSTAAEIVQELNPTINFQVGDVARVPMLPGPALQGTCESLDAAFTLHESHREPSVEFKFPGPSPWRCAQDWAQRAVDRPKGEALPPCEEELDEPAAEAHVSFAVGVALGRFGADGEGILDAVEAKAEATLPVGILFLSEATQVADSLGHEAARGIEEAWAEHGAAITGGKQTSLRDWLRKDFFGYHKGLYENRPIYFPLSSAGKAFVAHVSIHRWADNTLQALLASHLHPARDKLEGELKDINAARASSDKQERAQAEKQYAKSQKLLEELCEFIAAVTECAERGAPPTDAKCPAREVDAPFRMDLDDGVMVNSAALWPLLLPQWKDPEKAWKELACADGRKDYDWAHLAQRYFPARVDAKCQEDPSLAVAHGCFWKCHPVKAYAWELRLQDEIRAEFTIEEEGSDGHRAAYLAANPGEAEESRGKEAARRARNLKRKGDAGENGAQGELGVEQE